MQTLILAVVFGLAAGLAVGLQGPLTSLMSARIGAMASVFVVHLGGTIAAGVLLLALSGERIGAWRSVPWYALGAGLLGLVVLTAVSYTYPRIGAAATTSLIIAAQLSLGVVLDQFGLLGVSLRPLDLPRLAGIVVLFLGAWMIVR